MSFLITSDDNALHVICQNISGDPHICKGMQHADEEVFLLGIREEFNIPLPAMVSDHGKACNPVGSPLVSLNLYKSPVHLEGFTWAC